MAKVTIIVNGKQVTIDEAVPGIFGQLGYQYVNGGPTTPTKTEVTNPVKVETGVANLPTITVPKELAENPYYKKLEPDNQTLIAYYWNVTNSQNEAKKTAFQDALKLAGESADPYWREKINIVKDETNRAFGSLVSDEASQEEDLSRRSKAIDEDLAYNKDYLTTEQQAELSRQKTTYDNQLATMRENMASRGLSSSSIKTQAQEQLDTANAGVIGSTQRAYDKQQRDLGVTAQRNVADITAQLQDLKRKLGENKATTARSAEKYLGSAEAGNIPGASSYLLGNVTGTMGEDKGSDILTRANALLGSSI